MFNRKRRELEALRDALELCNRTHGPFRELAEEIAHRVTETVQSTSLDDTIEHAVRELTEEKVADLLRSKFEQLSPREQLQLLLRHLPEAKKTAWLQAEIKRLERLANPQTAIRQLITDARRTHSLDIAKLPENTRLEITMLCHRCIKTPEDAATTDMDRKITVVRRKEGFYLLLDLYEGKNYDGAAKGVPHSTVFTLGILEMTSGKTGRLEQKLIFGGQAHFAYAGHHYPFSLYQGGSPQVMLVARCTVDGEEAFFGPE